MQTFLVAILSLFQVENGPQRPTDFIHAESVRLCEVGQEFYGTKKFFSKELESFSANVEKQMVLENGERLLSALTTGICQSIFLSEQGRKINLNNLPSANLTKNENECSLWVEEKKISSKMRSHILGLLGRDILDDSNSEKIMQRGMNLVKTVTYGICEDMGGPALAGQ